MGSKEGKSQHGEAMRNEYDFSRGERGKFHKRDVALDVPIYLDADNLSFVERIAERKNTDVSSVVNDPIRSDKQLAEARD